MKITQIQIWTSILGNYCNLSMICQILNPRILNRNLVIIQFILSPCVAKLSQTSEDYLDNLNFVASLMSFQMLDFAFPIKCLCSYYNKCMCAQIKEV